LADCVDAEVRDIPVVSHDDVLHCVQQKRINIIDVRKVDEVAEFGKIPEAEVLPGEFDFCFVSFSFLMLNGVLL